MNRIGVASLVCGVIAVGVAQAQSPTRLRGAVAGFDGTVLSVKSADGKNVPIGLDDKTVIVFAQPIKLSELRQGDFLAVTSNKRADGTLTAFEVRRFPKPLSPGHRPFDDRDDQTMTNATVTVVVQSANGRELTLTYEGGSQKITVPEDASISMLVPGERTQLVPGAKVNLTAAGGADGRLTARHIQVGP